MKPLPAYALLVVLAVPLAPAAPADAVVAIRGFGFKPDTLVVPVGTRVLWTNEDEIEHTVTAGAESSAAPALNGVLRGAGQTYRFTFTYAGTFSYACARHSFMRGTIRVTPTGDH